MIEFHPPPHIDLVGPLKLSSHGVFFMIASLIAYFWTRRRLGSEHYQAVEDVLPYMTVGAIIGARGLYVIQNPDLWLRPLEAIAIWKGGLVSYGGMVGALVAFWWFLKKRQLPAWKFCDALAPAAVFGWAVGRLGCLFSWYGETGLRCDKPWCFVVDGVARHPVMLYLSIGLALSTLLVLAAEKKGISPTGVAFLCYGLVRAFCDFFRDYDPPELQYSSQAVALLLAGVGVIVLVKHRSVNQERNVHPTTNKRINSTMNFSRE